MFCPQCRSSWPSSGNDGAVRVDKPKRDPRDASRWGRPLICPNCHIPLAPDRIQGEFPSVAYLSSTKEGSMTIRDVLRETASFDACFGDVALDDQKPEPSHRIFGFEFHSRNRFLRGVMASRSDPKGAMQRLGGFVLVVCISMVVFLSLHAIAIQCMKYRSVLKSSKSAKLLPSVYSVDEQDLLTIMPAQVGDWARCETTAQVLNDQTSSSNIDQVYTATYRLGTERAELWAVKVPHIQNESALQNFAGGIRAVHTDDGVVDVKPTLYSRGRKPYMQFDFTPAHPEDRIWIHCSTFVPPAPFTLSWDQGSYVVTVAAATSAERDDFVDAGGGLMQ